MDTILNFLGGKYITIKTKNNRYIKRSIKL